MPLTTGAEDFSYYAQEVPGLFVFVGVTDPAIDPRKAPTNHSPKFLVDEAGLPLALDVLVSLAVDYLQGVGK